MKRRDKMKKITSILITLIIFAITSCKESGDGITELAGNFWAQNMVTDAFYRVDAEKLAENSRCVVWAEKGSGVTAAMASTIANEYSSKIYVKMMNTFGYNINVTGVGIMNTMEYAHALATGKTSGAKLTILLLDIKDGYVNKNDPYVGGYFNPLDFYKDEHSNSLDMIYIDTYPSVPGSTPSYETFAHEMQHLMNFVSSNLIRKAPMDTWIDEGLSSATEWLYSGLHPEVRWKNYINDPSGLIAKGNNFYVWDNHDENPLANIDDYSTVYLFFQWLRLQSVNTDIYFNIHTSGFTNYKAVTDTEVKDGVSITKLGGTYNNNWPLILRDWHAANYTNATSGRYGYMNDTTLKTVKAPMVPGGTTSLKLFSGEGVYSKTSTAETVPGGSGNIRYAGLSSTGADPSDSTGFANGARLTYNVNTDIKDGVGATGNTTGIASVGISIPSGVSGSVQIGSNKFTGPFKVDASYFRKKNGNSDITYNEIRGLVGKTNGRSVNETNGTISFDVSKIERVFINE
jgi:hypothetical protein